MGEGMSTEIVDARRVLEWMRDPNRKPAQLAFTHGPERQAAYWIEIAQSEPEVAANNIDARFTHRLAIVLECMILNPTRFYDEACALIDEYKSAWEEVNPSPPTFMGEPVVLPERELAVTQHDVNDFNRGEPKGTAP